MELEFYQISFYALSAILVLAAILVVLLADPLYAGLSLMLTFFILWFFYVILGHEYLGAMQLLIYVGAIMVLFIFMIMLLNIREDKEKITFNLRFFAALLLSVSFFLSLAFNLELTDDALSAYQLAPLPDGKTTSYSNLFAEILIEKYALAVELVALLMLAGVLGAVMLTKKNYSADD